MFLTAGQRSDYIGARALLESLPPAKHMLADRGYDAGWYREALENKGILPCIPSRKGRKVSIPHDDASQRITIPVPMPTGGDKTNATVEAALRAICRECGGRCNAP